MFETSYCKQFLLLAYQGAKRYRIPMMQLRRILLYVCKRRVVSFTHLWRRNWCLAQTPLDFGESHKEDETQDLRHTLLSIGI